MDFAREPAKAAQSLEEDEVLVKEIEDALEDDKDDCLSGVHLAKDAAKADEEHARDGGEHVHCNMCAQQARARNHFVVQSALYVLAFSGDFGSRPGPKNRLKT